MKVTTKKPSAKELAVAFVEKCKEYGFTFSAQGSRVSVSKNFPAGSTNEFAKAETDSSILLDMIPTTAAGSTWGTDGASVGGAIALQSGEFKMTKSGCALRVINALNKL